MTYLEGTSGITVVDMLDNDDITVIIIEVFVIESVTL